MDIIETNKIEKILVTGSSGAIGSVLCPFLMKQGYYIRGFDKRKGGTTNEFHQGDLLNKDAIKIALTDIDAIIHLAAYADESDFETDLLPNNILGLKKMLDEACNQSIKKIIFASSIQAVDFSNDTKGYSVDDKSPFNFYGLTKSWGEDLAELYSIQYNISIIIARLGWFIRSKKEFEEICNYPNGSELYLSPNDLCQFFLKCLNDRNISFEKLYATSIPTNHEIFDLNPSKAKINYIPKDTFPTDFITKYSNDISSNVTNGEINLIHITDTHIFKDKNELLHGVKTFSKLKGVIQHIKEGTKDIDGIIITGDLSEDGSTESYQLINEVLEELSFPSFWLPGNHDNFENIPKELAQRSVFKSIEQGNWQLIFLDTVVEGEDHGILSEKELQRLDLFLNENHEKQILICMHHHPVDVQSEFIDSIGLKNKDDFWEILSSYSNIKGILSGHIHQEFNKKINGISIFSSPSTCVQWKPKAKKFTFTSHNEGYQKIQLNKSGIITSNPVNISNYFSTLKNHSNQ